MPKKTVKAPKLDVQASVSVDKKAKPPTAEDALAGTEAGAIWNEIRFKEIQMFALPGQTVSHYCKPAVVEPSKLYLLTTATSVLPSLEAAVGRNYVVESIDKYTVVSRAVRLPFAK